MQADSIPLNSHIVWERHRDIKLLARKMGDSAGSAVVLEPPELEGLRLSCYNSWSQFGKQSWANVTFRLASWKWHQNVTGVASDETNIQWALAPLDAYELFPSDTAQKNSVLLTKGFPTSNLMYNLLPSYAASWSAPERSRYVVVDCGATTKAQVAQVSKILEVIENSPAFTVSLRLEKPLTSPFEALYDSMAFRGLSTALNTALLLVAVLGLVVLVEHALFYLQRRRENRNSGLSYPSKLQVGAVVIEVLSLSILVAYTFGTWSLTRPSSFILRDTAVGLSPLLPGFGLLSTMIVWKYWTIALKGLPATGSPSRQLLSPRAFKLVSCLFLAMDLFVLSFSKLLIRLPLIYQSVSGILALSTLFAGAVFFAKTREVLRVYEAVAGTGASSGPNNVQSRAKERILYVSRLARISGISMMGSILCLLWFSFDNVVYVPSKWAIFSSFLLTLRIITSATQIAICRLPPRIRADVRSARPRSTRRSTKKVISSQARSSRQASSLSLVQTVNNSKVSPHPSLND